MLSLSPLKAGRNIPAGVCCCGCEQSENLINCGGAAGVSVSLVCTSCMLYVVVEVEVVVGRPLTSPADVSTAPPSLLPL